MLPRRRLTVGSGSGEPLSLTVALLVFAGLAGSGLVNIWIEAPREGALPGIALGSQTLLVAERGVAFFAIWLLVLVVSAQALRGRLPIEISGRGLRYADGSQTQDSIASTEEALRRLDEETKALHRDVANLAAREN
jgi:hypothetical protein